MNTKPVHGVPGEGINPRRNTLDDDNENGGVDSNHGADSTGNGDAWKQKNGDPDPQCAGCRPEPLCQAAALAYATVRGWAVFPAPPDAKKAYKSAEYSNGSKWGKTKDPDEIRRDWAHWPDANIGIPTGIENGFFVVEADTVKGHGVDGLAEFAKLVAGHGALPSTLMAESPSGSVHRYFQHPGNGIKIKNSASEIANGVDVRGDGGMVIAPPSIRADGSYRWLNDLPIAVAPPWLIELVKEQPHTRNEDAEPEADPAMIAAALAVVPNDDLDWESWNRIGMATWRGTAGKGYALFDTFSQKSKKYDARNTLKKWEGYFSSPPDSIGAGTIFYLADQADPGWRWCYDAQVMAELNAAGAGSEADRQMCAELGINLKNRKLRNRQRTTPSNRTRQKLRNEMPNNRTRQAPTVPKAAASCCCRVLSSSRALSRPTTSSTGCCSARTSTH
jgi:Bifunctional DNA primase/polymerase, N-terminal/Primase C terminal 2 (PriCT-2)